MKLLVAFSLALALASGCDETSENQQLQPTRKLENDLEELNRKLMRDEGAQIDGFAERMNWPMTTSGTGLRYWIYDTGAGIQAKEGMIAKVEYIVSLLNGDTLYTSEKNGPKEFLIGQDNVESGLHEGIQLLHVGDRARFILPSHLAHGLSGDQDKIPPRHSVVYDIKLLNVR